MQRALAVICVLHAGCGRFGFTEQPEPDGAPAIDTFVCDASMHDEDGDGVDDACDVCPHLAGPQTDSDGDRVGDACDPEPANPRQQITLFDPFETLAAPWSASSGAIVTGGRLRIGAPGEARYISRPYTLGSDLFVVGGATGPAGAAARVLAITMGSSTPARFYCELYDNTLSTELKFTYTLDGSAYMFGDETPAANQVLNGAGTFRMATSGTVATCSSTWHGEPLSANGTIPAIPVEQLLLYAENIDASIDYFLQIHTDE